MTEIKRGDYVLATKYSDGDPGDHWVVGFYDRQAGDRHCVVDALGRSFRANGFRRVRKINGERGRWMLDRRQDIELSTRSVWSWVRCKMEVSPAIALAKRTE